MLVLCCENLDVLDPISGIISPNAEIPKQTFVAIPLS